MNRLKRETIDLIRSRPDVLGGLAKEMGVHISTIERWLSANHIMLTTVDCLDYLHLNLRIAKSELYSKQPILEITNKRTKN